MRRLFVYPHRSVRTGAPTLHRWVAAAVCAAGLTLAVNVLAGPLLVEHTRISVALLQIAGIPVEGFQPATLFASFSAVPVPVISVLRLEFSPFRHWLLLCGAMLILLILHGRIPFARNFLTFLMTLLLVASGVILFHPSSQFGSSEFVQMWLRAELLVWMVLPWLSAGMFVLTQQAAFFGVVWAVLVQAYGFVWSAVRISFGLALMHYSGILFAPMFWFALGFLADLVYVVVFYSVAVNLSAKWAPGRRRA